MFQGKAFVCRFKYRIAVISTILLAFAQCSLHAQAFATPINVSGENSNAAAPRMAVDSHGNVDVVWLDDSAGTPAVFFSRSSDGGQIFSAPLNISNHDGSPAESERVAVAPTGNIYVVWSEDSAGAHTIFFSRSMDGGASFSVPQKVSQNSMGTDPAIAIDSTGGVNLIWVDNSGGEYTVFFSRSTDHGATFSPPSILSAGDGPPQLATDENGNAYAVWTNRNMGAKKTLLFSHAATAALPSRHLTNVSTGLKVDQALRIQVFAADRSQISSSEEENTPRAHVIQKAKPRMSISSSSASASITPDSAGAAGVIVSPTAEDLVSPGDSASAPSDPPVTMGQIKAYNLNNILYVDGNHFKTIQAAVDALPKINSKPAGIVWVTAPIVIATGQEVTIGPYTQLRFSPGAVVTYSGSGVPFTCFDAPTSYGGDGGIYDLTLDGNPTAYAGIVNDECSWFHIEHTYVQNFTNGSGIIYENTQRWTEQTTWIDVHSQNNYKSFDFQDNCSGHTGCPSFAYSRFYHVVATPMPNSDGFVLENDSDINNGDLELSCFLNSRSVCLHLMDSAEINPARVWIRGEFTRGSNATGIKADLSTIWQPIGLMERWDQGTGLITDDVKGKVNLYAWKADGYSLEQIFRQGPAWGASGNSFLDTLDVSHITNYRSLVAPDASGTIAVSGASFHANSPLVCTDDNALLTTTGCASVNENNTAISTGASCSTPAHAFASCTSTIPLARPERNTAYGASCTGIGPHGWPYIMGVVSKTRTTITVQIGNGSGPAALASSFNEIDCTLTR